MSSEKSLGIVQSVCCKLMIIFEYYIELVSLDCLPRCRFEIWIQMYIELQLPSHFPTATSTSTWTLSLKSPVFHIKSVLDNFESSCKSLQVIEVLVASAAAPPIAMTYSVGYEDQGSGSDWYLNLNRSRDLMFWSKRVDLIFLIIGISEVLIFNLAST